MTRTSHGTAIWRSPGPGATQTGTATGRRTGTGERLTGTTGKKRWGSGNFPAPFSIPKCYNSDMKYLSHSHEETHKIAEDFLNSLVPSERATVVALQGELGAGKTAFTQETGKILGVADDMQSPTFVIEKIYDIVGSEEADSDQNKISNRSPLGEALLHKKKGETVTFETPGGVVKYKILSID